MWYHTIKEKSHNSTMSNEVNYMQQRITINLNTDSKKTDKTTILEYCRSHGIAGIETPCGGKGTCGKCKVTVTKPYYKDVLACQTKICDGMEIIVGRKESTGTKEDSMVVLTNGGNVSEKFNEHVNEHVNRNVVLKEETANESEKVESNEDTLAACDIGTTTVVCYLIDKETGQIISTRSGANPQRSFGADVLSRIDAAARADDNDKANGMENYMQLVRVYFQASIAANVGIANLAMLPDLRVFKSTLHVPTVNNKLGVGEKSACRKMLRDIYGVDDNFFKEVDASIRKNCRKLQDVQVYLIQFQNFTQDIMMLMGNLMKFKLRLPSFFKNAIYKMTEKTVADIFTKNDYSDAAVMKAVVAIRQYDQRLGFSQKWITDFVFQVVMLAKKEPKAGADDGQKK